MIFFSKTHLNDRNIIIVFYPQDSMVEEIRIFSGAALTFVATFVS